MSVETYTALLVDRNQGTRKTLASVLRQAMGIKNILESASAREAMGMLKNTNKVDWIFSDTSLPDQDCFTFIADAKTAPSAKDSAFIILSTQTSRELLLKAASAGVNDFIKKPFTSSTVVVKLRKLIDGKSQRATNRVHVLGAYEALLEIGGETVKSALVDLSLGGCLVTAPPIGKFASVYDTVKIKVSGENGSFAVAGDIVRIERHVQDEEKLIQIAFQFIDVKETTSNAISHFIASINRGQ